MFKKEEKIILIFVIFSYLLIVRAYISKSEDILHFIRLYASLYMAIISIFFIFFQNKFRSWKTKKIKILLFIGLIGIGYFSIYLIWNGLWNL